MHPLLLSCPVSQDTDVLVEYPLCGQMQGELSAGLQTTALALACSMTMVEPLTHWPPFPHLYKEDQTPSQILSSVGSVWCSVPVLQRGKLRSHDGDYSPWTVEHRLLEISLPPVSSSPDFHTGLFYSFSSAPSEAHIAPHVSTMAPFIQTRVTVPNIEQPVWVGQSQQKADPSRP